MVWLFFWLVEVGFTWLVLGLLMNGFCGSGLGTYSFLLAYFFFPHSVLHKAKANGHLDGVFVNATLIEMDWVTLGVSHLRRQVVDGWVVQDTSFPKRTRENE